ncbi:DNA damage-binding protein 2 isoform X2 [Delphinapterus leucas]|uniref:DNA damage-binding protein 2 n=1 Tax=Delphinapterus leucas TaxID=9749 RepID=A0A7F8KGH6_DELLE|nr:DNA damage-binding protein 2 isoform X2 [Delphinapterus leucas]XP_030619960.1 DNA damage-binding protein 2 isoform X2 [Delphinapterus leucas]XP_030619961.1 DNA damage-binding protein 2 isoform X2 [Delphinapterus leucas]
MPNEGTRLSFWDVSAEKSLSEIGAENMCLFCLAGPSRRFDSGCLWAGLASLRVPPPCSIVRALHQHKLGTAAWPSLQQGLQQSFLNSLASYRIFQKAAPFDRRATSLAWHPTHPSTLAVGSKGGDILLWNFGIKDKPTFIKGIGAGGSITGLKFNPLNTNQFFTSSMEGTTRLQDFKGNTLRVFASSGTCNFWFCSLDVSVRSRVVVTGDNVGNVILLNMDGRELWNLRMHKKKVTHVALNPCCDWFLATASVDQTVKIWDLRQVRGKSSFLYSLLHRHPVNAAHFSPDGAQLLTTDQKSEIRVYSASQWDCPPSLIPHPHRHFQHLTPIKATWHPRYNLIVVGRYPDPNFKSCTSHELRTIDVFDGSSGKMMYQLYDPESSGIMSVRLGPSNNNGRKQGFTLPYWIKNDQKLILMCPSPSTLIPSSCLSPCLCSSMSSIPWGTHWPL